MAQRTMTSIRQEICETVSRLAMEYIEASEGLYVIENIEVLTHYKHGQEGSQPDLAIVSHIKTRQAR